LVALTGAFLVEVEDVSTEAAAGAEVMVATAGAAEIGGVVEVALADVDPAAPATGGVTIAGEIGAAAGVGVTVAGGGGICECPATAFRILSSI